VSGRRHIACSAGLFEEVLSSAHGHCPWHKLLVICVGRSIASV